VLRALTSASDADVELASVYLSHRPMTDVEELRGAATGIARMPGSGAQIRALDTLARHRLSDGQSLTELARLFPTASSVDVQRAIASVLIRADYHAIAKPEFVRTLAQNRRKSPDGTDIIDILIRRLRTPD
jgi:RES domain-containing protein